LKFLKSASSAVAESYVIVASNGLSRVILAAIAESHRPIGPKLPLYPLSEQYWGDTPPNIFCQSSVNASNQRSWVKFHFRTQQSIQNLTDEEAEALIGKDRETHGRDLYESIEGGEFPRWTLFVQVMNGEQASACPFNPFDLTKVWPKAEFPLIEVGYFELNRNPKNYFAEVEQAAFSPANIVPGIGFSPDKMLQARLFSYGDTQRYRLGVNFNQIPVNAPKCPFHSYHRDGAMRTDDNQGGTTSYYPNSFEKWNVAPGLHEPVLPIAGDAAHWDHRVDDDHYKQPGDLFRRMSKGQQYVLFENTARQIGGAARFMQERHIVNCTKADPAYGAGIRDALARRPS
jgi:catalase